MSYTNSGHNALNPELWSCCTVAVCQMIQQRVLHQKELENPTDTQVERTISRYLSHNYDTLNNSEDLGWYSQLLVASPSVQAKEWETENWNHFPTRSLDTEKSNYTLVPIWRWRCATLLSALAWLFFQEYPAWKMAWLLTIEFSQRPVSSSAESITDSNLPPKVLLMLWFKILALLFVVDCYIVILTQS